jgi:hypothetical protein
MGLMVGVVGLVGCGGDSNSPTGPSEEITKWRKTFAEGQYTGHSVQQTVDGGFIVTGWDKDDDGMFLLKTNKLGNI